MIDERCDIYGIGMLLYYMASGTKISPNSRNMPNIDHKADCSEQLKRIINRCLRFNPVLRYPSIEQLEKHLSVLKGRRHSNWEPGHRITVAIAGSQPRVGVTHLAFRLCLYLKSRNVRCLYQESNSNECIQSIKNYVEMKADRQENLSFQGISIRSREPGASGEAFEAAVLLVDYGKLSEDNQKQFLEADIKLLVLGAKEWELAYSEEVLDRIAEYKEIFYLFSFLDGKQFQRVTANMEQRGCYRIPYEPNPYAKTTARNGQELFDELLGLGASHLCGGKRPPFHRKKGRRLLYEEEPDPVQ